MSSKIFSFPNPVNDLAARTVAVGVIVLSVAALATQQLWLTIPLAYGFVARTASGPRFSPLALVATKLVAPRLSDHPKLVPGPPKRFAQSIGAVFTLAALALWLAGESTAAYVLLGILLVPATAEAVFGYCVGCEIFRLLMRAGVIPESACEQCADLWGMSTVQRSRA